LPLPLSLYVIGTAAAIVFSVVIVGLFVRGGPQRRDYPHHDLLANPICRLLTYLALPLKLIALILFVVAVSAGFWGNPNPYQNLAPTLVWVVGWVGVAYLSAFVGNVWVLINPWRTLFDWAGRLYRLLMRDRSGDFSLGLKYRDAFGVWPALFLLLVFSWIELVYPSPALPSHIAWLALAYSIVTWIGMALYGGEEWLRHGEVFAVVFSTFARFAPTEVRVHAAAVCQSCRFSCRDADGRCIDCHDCFRRAHPPQRELALRPFAVGLLDDAVNSLSMTAFVLLVLATVLYDGILATPEWTELESKIVAFVPGSGDGAAIAFRTIGLGACWLLFFGAYLAIAAVMHRAVHGQRSVRDIAQGFALTLVPIAIAYHLAHYLTFLLIQGQYIVPLLSDPFGYGWNLFGTAGYRVDIGIVGARFTWYAAVTAIVLGHICAVYLAHVRAMRLFGSRSSALRSQVPLTALMVAYTFVSLSILAEPITERRPAAQPVETVATEIRVPETALLPDPSTGEMRPVGPGKVAKQKLTYRMLGSAYHDGTLMTAADLLYAYSFAYRWGTRADTNDAHYDPVVDAATAVLRERLLGVSFQGTDTASKSFRVAEINVVRELFLMDVYLSTATEDPEQDAVIAPPWSTIPWHLLVLMEEAVSRGWGAFSSAEAARRGVPWLDLVRSQKTNDQLASLVAEFEREGYRPAALQSLVTADEARKRWAAIAAFYQAHHHFLVTNGPYQLKEWLAESAVLDVFRDLSYPLGVGSYDAYAIPRRGFITQVQRENDRLKLLADIETINKFQRSYEIVRQSLAAVSPDVLKRAAPACRYVVVDANDRVVLTGEARLADDSTFQIDLKGKLAAGQYTMFAEIDVNENAMNAEIKRIPIVISPSPRD